MATTPLPLLVVEDDKIVRLLIGEVLAELGYQVIEAENGESALKVLRDPQQSLALMMTDVGLPDTDGITLAQQAREARPLLPILFASGTDGVPVPSGMHLIGKPFSIDQLRTTLTAILAESTTAPQA